MQFDFKDLQYAAKMAAESGLFGEINTEAKAYSVMMIAAAEGYHPATGLIDYGIVKGRPAIKAEAALKRFQAAGGEVVYLSLTSQKVEVSFTWRKTSATICWTIEEAAAANLLKEKRFNKATGSYEMAWKETWKKYPRAMLRSRVISEGCRTIMPAALGGLYTKEEVEDFSEDDWKNKKTYPPIKEEPSQPEPLDFDDVLTTAQLEFASCENADQLKESYVKFHRSHKDHPRFEEIIKAKDQIKDVFVKQSEEKMKEVLGDVIPEAFQGSTVNIIEATNEQSV